MHVVWCLVVRRISPRGLQHLNLNMEPADAHAPRDLGGTVIGLGLLVTTLYNTAMCMYV